MRTHENEHPSKLIVPPHSIPLCSLFEVMMVDIYEIANAAKLSPCRSQNFRAPLKAEKKRTRRRGHTKRRPEFPRRGGVGYVK